MPLLGSGLLYYQCDVDPANEREYNDYYLRQHLIERVCVPGFLGARRFRSVDGSSPRYLNFYEAIAPSTFFSEPYQWRLANPSDWSKRAMPWFVKGRRVLCRVIESQGNGMGAAAWVLSFEVGNELMRPALRSWLTGHVARLARLPEIVCAHAFEREGERPGKTAESMYRREPDRSFDFALVVEAERPSALTMCESLAKHATELANVSSVESSPRYQFLFAIPPGSPSALPALGPNREFFDTDETNFSRP